MDWIDRHQQNLYAALKEARRQNAGTIPAETVPCLHLLCFMICLSTVFAEMPSVSTDENATQMAVHVWKKVMKKTDLKCDAIKLIPKESTFDTFAKDTSKTISDNFLTRFGKWLGVDRYLNSVWNFCFNRGSTVGSDPGNSAANLPSGKPEASSHPPPKKPKVQLSSQVPGASASNQLGGIEIDGSETPEVSA